MDIEPHGGFCCGITHLYNFPSTGVSEASRADKIAKWVAAAKKVYKDDGAKVGPDWHSAIEAVINEIQLDNWRKPLEANGFKEVFSFHNSNSGNRCYVFYLETGE